MNNTNNKPDAYYFSHDSNALTDPKILSMRCDYGLEGYGLYWAIIEMLRNEKTYKLPLDKNTYRAIKIQTNAQIDIEEFITNCISEYIGSSGNGLFNSDGKYFWSESLLKRMVRVDEVREKRKAAGKKGLEKRWKNNQKTKSKIILRNIKNIVTYSKSIANAIDFNSKCNSKSIANAIKNHSKTVAKNSKRNEMKRNEMKRNNIILNYTTLDLLFNYLTYDNQNFGNLQEKNRIAIINILKRLQLYPVIIDYYTKEELLDLKLKYWTIMEIYLSPYKAYLNDITINDFLFRFLKTKEYVNCNSESDLEHFISYFIKSLREELRKNEQR